MRRVLKWFLRLLLIAALAAVVMGIWKREEIKRLLAVNSLFSEEKIIGNFSNMDAAFLHTPVPRGDGPVMALPKGAALDLPPVVRDWITARDVTSLLVLKDGEIVFEDYFLGTKPDDLRISWSVAKSYLSALIGVLLDEGVIASIEDPVTKYAPELVGSAYETASIRNVLNMASGVVFNEDYLDYNSDINKMGRVLALGGEMDTFAANLREADQPPGSAWRYVSIDTHVLSMVVRGAARQPIADLLSEKIIAPLGVERTPYYLTDGVGTAFVLGGLNVTTRDYARFGQLFLQSGQVDGRQIIPADWVAASTAPSAPTAPGAIGYGFQWWIPQGSVPGQFMARGVYGQYIYVDRPNGVVIATTAADRNFRAEGVSQQNIDIFRLISNSL